MQLSALHRHSRPPTNPTFANHTPRHALITTPAGSPSQSLPPDMFGPLPAMTIGPGPGPVYDRAIMGQASSSSDESSDESSSSSSTTTADVDAAGNVRKASSTIWRQDSIQQHFEQTTRCPSPVSPLVEHQTLPLSTPDSWSMHYACTTQAPYSTPTLSADEHKMITQTSLARLPKDNELYDLAFFLRTTGPAPPHRKPSKIQHPTRAVSGKAALRLLRLRGQKQHHQRHPMPVQTAHERLNRVVSNSGDYTIPDEGGLLADTHQSVPVACEQKLSSTGKRYLALKPKEEPRLHKSTNSNDHPMLDYQPSILSPDILESRVSVCFHDDVTSATGDVLQNYGGHDFDHWLSHLEKQQDPHESAKLSTNFSTASTAVDLRSKPASSYQEVAHRLARHRNNPTPVRPAASEPPSPVPESAISVADSHQSDTFDRPPPKPCFDTARALTSHPISPIQEGCPHTPTISLPHEEFPVKHPSPGKEIEIRHPLPRRLGSHPVLLQRASSIASTMYQRSVSESLIFPDSPGPPPPKSPLRLRRDPRTIEHVVSSHETARKGTPKIAPSIKSSADFNYEVEPMRAVVTTECTGPMSRRPKSREKTKQGIIQHMPYPANRREREERVRARKLRDRPSAMNRTIDSVVHAPAQVTRQRLKKLRPQITIPDLRPPPLRAPSAASRTSMASSSGSWQKVTQSTSPVSPVPSCATQESDQDQTGYTPISPSASAEARAAQAGLCLSPMMLVAEERPVPKTKTPPKPAKLVIKEAKSKAYAPRPRSASLPRNAFKQRRLSRNSNSIHSSPRASSPVLKRFDDDAPPLPSPPPNRALPPTPLAASGSEKPNTGVKRCQQLNTKELPVVPSHDVPPISTSPKKNQSLPHIATQKKTSATKHSEWTPTRATSRIDARLEALEKQNAILSAALMAVLKTNGTFNAPISGLPEVPDSPKGPMAWETRIARRSAATTGSHTASSSNASALEMYMNTRRGSRHGRSKQAD
ncbi:hypothetical protein AC579_323 [Pseudocercospora musae]|uniref:Uncharacterized protein n=1 Tax=Pseudocercospora musae TaxID=113226 RepID=A0A139IRN7_9PEZI|nr:hypothetical protein AC579_323 [Pseudocercospora musae]